MRSGLVAPGRGRRRRTSACLAVVVACCCVGFGLAASPAFASAPTIDSFSVGLERSDQVAFCENADDNPPSEFRQDSGSGAFNDSFTLPPRSANATCGGDVGTSTLSGSLTASATIGSGGFTVTESASGSASSQATAAAGPGQLAFGGGHVSATTDVTFTIGSATSFTFSGSMPAHDTGRHGEGGDGYQLLKFNPGSAPTVIFQGFDTRPGDLSPSIQGTLDPGQYQLALAGSAQDQINAPPSDGESVGFDHRFTFTAGSGNPTKTSVSCPGDSNHPTTAGSPGAAITCNVSVDDTCAASCSPSTPTGSVSIDFADGTADPSCTLIATANPAHSSCDVSVTPNAQGPHEIAADYAGDADHNPSADRTTFTTKCAPAQGQEVKVGNAVALGCFEERKDANGKGTGVFETDELAWIGGFEAVPDPGAKLVLDTGNREVREEGGSVDLRIDGTSLALPVGALPVKLSSADVELGRSGSIEKAVLDLPLDGKLKVSWSGGGTATLLEGEVSVSKVTSAIGLVTTTGSGTGADFKFSAKLSNGKGLELSTAEAKIDEIDVTPKIFKLPRPLALKNLTFNYSRKTDPVTGQSRPFWSAGGLISLPFTQTPIDLGGKVFVFDGSLAGAGIAVDGINKPIPDTPLFLQKVSGDLVLRPDFGVNTTVGATFGPRIAGKQLFTLDGNLTAGALVSALDCGNGPDPFKIDATLKFVPLEDQQLAKVEMTQRICTYASFASIPGLVGQDVTMQGKLEFLHGAFGYEGSQSGFVGNHGANLEGSATIKLPGAFDPNGKVILSTIGIAACGGLNGGQVGFGYHWGDLAPGPFTGCDFTSYKVPASTASVRAAGDRVVPVPSGLPSVAFAVTGSTGAPRLRVSGPRGVTFSSPADGGTLHTSRVLIAPSPSESKTYVIVKTPAGGDWRFESLDATNAITRVALANGLPHPHVRARLRHRAHGLLELDYRVTPIPGQRVNFLERGPATERNLGSAHGRGGTIRFRPYITATTRRTILAEVIENNLPRAVITLARYHAPAAHPPSRPRVAGKRSRTSIVLRWNKIPGAVGYIVVVAAGHSRLAGLFTRSTHLTIPNMPRRGTVRVSLRAASNITPPGPPATLSLKASR